MNNTPDFTVATWNINSIRARMDSVERFLVQHAPDVLCLQETKVVDGLFPAELFARHGYHHQIIHGQPSYNGVATLSKLPLREVARLDWQDNGEARHLGVELGGKGQGILLENVYIPAGGDIPDRDENPKFGQKLDFVERMARWAQTLDRPTLIVGDFNIAPLESDVWSHKALTKVVSHTPIEVAALGRFRDAHGWADLGRQFIPAPLRNYSWWSYRNRDHTANDRGRRLDHMWASPALASQAVSHAVIEETRSWDKPSDHVPLITGFRL